MSDDIKINEKALRDLKLLVESKTWGEIRRADHAKGLRGEVTANWLDSFMNRMYRNEIDKSKDLINSRTGQPHTVDSMVADLRERVKLDVLTKSSENDIPLSKKMAEQAHTIDMEKITHAIENFLSSHRGHADDQAILYFLRDTFGADDINKLSDDITKKIEGLKEKHKEPMVDNDAIEDAVLGQPLKLDEQDLKQDEQIFTNIQNGLGRKN